MWEPNLRYPDASVISITPAFDQYRLVLASVERLATGLRWAEGPVWFGDGRYLLVSDIPNNRIVRWDDVTGQISDFRRPSDHANGNTRDRQGRLVTCEHDTRRVTRTEIDGGITVIADRFDGKPLNSPNDLVVKSDGTIWFSDPPFGILGEYEGHRAEIEQPHSVYRFDPRDGKLSRMDDMLEGPNGLAFSPDEKLLYVVASRANPRQIVAFDVLDDGARIANPRVVIEAEPGGTPDGFRVDVDGNLWCGWGMGTAEQDGVRVYSPAGELIGRIALPERCANLCFGGRKRNRLFMAASHSIYALYVNTQGATGG
jgi:gluconolactonase